ncbi:hypothetical protein CYMTET_18914 [Cymbomonas tetramitiformis]|uniref:Uncharacterized protein n=1 Tax=Cymbomonas tetramitiformis TaxID=36881 RepID=A0AAE0L5V4_9CHLO|nr:hypothetical protein CYMTET_18914 [Cymbomonas tetramitiformis]
MSQAPGEPERIHVLAVPVGRAEAVEAKDELTAARNARGPPGHGEAGACTAGVASAIVCTGQRILFCSRHSLPQSALEAAKEHEEPTRHGQFDAATARPVAGARIGMTMAFPAFPPAAGRRSKEHSGGEGAGLWPSEDSKGPFGWSFVGATSYSVPLCCQSACGGDSSWGIPAWRWNEMDAEDENTEVGAGQTGVDGQNEISVDAATFLSNYFAYHT